MSHWIYFVPIFYIIITGYVERVLYLEIVPGYCYAPRKKMSQLCTELIPTLLFHQKWLSSSFCVILWHHSYLFTLSYMILLLALSVHVWCYFVPWRGVCSVRSIIVILLNCDIFVILSSVTMPAFLSGFCIGTISNFVWTAKWKPHEKSIHRAKATWKKYCRKQETHDRFQQVQES